MPRSFLFNLAMDYTFAGGSIFCLGVWFAFCSAIWWLLVALLTGSITARSR